MPSEPELCERFGFSRIVIREAIKSLVAKGMLEVSRRVGTVVLEQARWNLFDPQVIAWRAESAESDPTMARDLMELRRIVEPAAVRLAAERASESERRALRAAYMAMVRAVAGKGDYVEADLAFHTTILSACGNQYVRQMQEALVGDVEGQLRDRVAEARRAGTVAADARGGVRGHRDGRRRGGRARGDHADRARRGRPARAVEGTPRCPRSQARGGPRRGMKITALTTYRVAPRWMFLKVETDEGISGWGEPVLEGRAETVETAVRELGATLIGQDPRRINDHWQSMDRGHFYRGGAILMSAIAGIDQALWDIKGKALGVPVYELLGGRVRERMKVYSWVGGDRPADVIDNIAAPASKAASTPSSSTAAKRWRCSTRCAPSTVRWPSSPRCARPSATRSTSAWTSTAASLHRWPSRCSRRSSRTGRCSSRSRCWPSRPSITRAWPRPPRSRSPPASACTRASSSSACFEGGGIAIVQPDLSHAGGITECHKIAAMAEAYDVALAPHCPLGPVALAACLQLDFVAWNAMLQEQSMGIHYNRGAELLDYVLNKDDFRIEDGCIAALPKPGLGVEVDEERILHASRNPPDWHNPAWRHADGSVAEW